MIQIDLRISQNLFHLLGHLQLIHNDNISVLSAQATFLPLSV